MDPPAHSVDNAEQAAIAAQSRRGLLWGLLGVVIFGLTLPATRLAVGELDPVVVTLGRALLAAVLAALTLMIARRPAPRRADWPRLAAFAACVVLGFPLQMAIAMRYAPAAHGGVVLAVLPLLTAMASVWLAGERPSRGFWACGVLGMAAVVAYAVLAGARAGGGAAAVHWADLLLAGAAVSAATGYALGGELSRRLGGWEVISWALVIAAPFVALLCVVLAPPINWGASSRVWLGFLYLGVFSQFIGFFAWNKGLALGGIAKVGQTQLLQTFVTLAAAAALLGEPVGVLELVFSLAVAVLVALGWRMRVARAATPSSER